MAIKGSLKEASIPDVMQMLSMGRKTGVLSITNGEEIVYIYFEDGEITGAGSVSKADKIGDILIAREKITEDQLNEALDIQKSKPDLLLGEILYERGYVDEETLREALAEQIKQVLFYVFKWEEGIFNFEPGVNKVKRLASIKIKPEDLLLDAARIIDELGIVQFPDMKDLLTRTHVKPESLKDEERRVYEIIDGNRTVEETLELTRMDEFVAMKALASLIEKGYVKATQPPPISKERAFTRISEHENLGIAFLHMDMLDEAEREFRRILEIDPANSRSRFFLAIIKFLKGEGERAVELLEEAINSGYQHPSLYSNLGVFLERMGKLDRAEEVLNEAIEHWKDVGILYLNRGIVRFYLGNLKEAREDLEKFLELEVENPIARYYLALIERIEGNIPDALNHMLEGLTASPDFPEYYNNLGRLYEETDEYEQAESMFKKALKLNPEYIPARMNLANFYYRNGYYKIAMDEYKKLSLLGVENWEIYFKMGNIVLKRGDVKEALRYYTMSLDLDPDNEVVKRNIEILQKDYGMGI